MAQLNDSAPPFRDGRSSRDIIDDIPPDLFVRVVALLRRYNDMAEPGTVMRIRRDGAGNDEVTLMRVDQRVTTNRNAR